MDRIADIIADNARKLAVLAIISVVVPLYYLPRMTIDNSIEVWLRQESPEFQTYQAFINRFGSEEFVVVALEAEDPLAEGPLKAQRELSAALKGIDGVDKIFGLPQVCESVSQLPDWQEETRKNPFLKNLLIGPEQKNAGMMILLKSMKGPKARRKVVEAIEAATANISQQGYRTHLAGTPVMNVSLDRSSESAAATFLPVAVGVSILVLVLMLRNCAAVIATMGCVGLSVAWTVGIMAMTGKTMNMVTVILPSLLFVLALSNGIHLASRFMAHLASGCDRDEACHKTLRELIRPALLSSITTAVGFASLMSSEMKPVSNLGLFAAIGMLIALICNLCGVPGILSLLSSRVRPSLQPRRSVWVNHVGTFAASHHRAVLLLAILIFSGCAFFASQLTTESNVLKFFPPDSRIARDYEFVGKELTGFYTVELDIRTNEEDEENVQSCIKRLAEAITGRTEVARVEHYSHLTEFVDELVLASSLDGTVSRPEFADDLTRRYRRLDHGQVQLRLSVLVRAMASADFYALLDFIRSQTDADLPAGTEWEMTGVVSLLNDVQRSLISTQVRSFALAAVSVVIMIGLLFGSMRVAAASILPNFLPIAIVFGIMAAAGIPLDPATVMIASIAIGIAVDDTIHFLSCFRIERLCGLSVVEASSATLSKVGGAIVFTSVVAAVGFGVVCLADFRPVQYFGLLTGITMISALGADLVVLPACARVFNLWEKR